MADIKVGQLVRIKGFGKQDAGYKNHDALGLIGQTGRFIEWRDKNMFLPAPWSWDGHKTWAGDFEYDPDPLDENKFLPAFVSIYVEPVEEQNEQE